MSAYLLKRLLVFVLIQQQQRRASRHPSDVWVSVDILTRLRLFKIFPPFTTAGSSCSPHLVLTLSRGRAIKQICLCLVFTFSAVISSLLWRRCCRRYLRFFRSICIVFLTFSIQMFNFRNSESSLTARLRPGESYNIAQTSSVMTVARGFLGQTYLITATHQRHAWRHFFRLSFIRQLHCS